MSSLSAPHPLTYPAAIIRKHSPCGYTDYKSYKDWLRDEFVFRCIYCLTRELWNSGGHGYFSVDHIKPQRHHPELKFIYSNLVYSCNRCNSAKRDTFLRKNPELLCTCTNITCLDTGVLEAINHDGQYIIDLLSLNYYLLIEERRRILMLYQHYISGRLSISDYCSFFGYPSDLPNLSSKKPHGGTLASSNHMCHYDLKEANLLPECY